MPEWVYAFHEGSGDQSALLGGKGANLPRSRARRRSAGSICQTTAPAAPRRRGTPADMAGGSSPRGLLSPSIALSSRVSTKPGDLQHDIASQADRQ
jgi:hypothetical protein